ncbi:MAG TPA: AmmeMemoRadiSam system protein A [Povalibacter sp.]|nr:AmmeMemoRadiSam system protein A [Povalibacter sp.]
MPFDATHRRQLLSLARQSIQLGLSEGRFPPYPRTELPAHFSLPRSTFVTLRIEGNLRGCCGSIEAQRPLTEDLWRNAWASAFSDPRFPPLTLEEYPAVALHISVLTQLEPLPVESEAELLQTLRPGIDGLLLRLHDSQVTFLPTVWQQLPAPAQFVQHLKLKAGWPAEFWSPQIRSYRYATESFGERA